MSLFYAAASFFAERIRVNSIESGTRDGRRVWIKRRRGSATFTLACANLFFRLAGNPVHALSESRKWQQWEVNSFTQLHGDQYRAFAEGDSAVVAQELPGVSMAKHLDRALLTPAMAAAAGREMRRCHSIWSEAFAGG